MKHHIMIRCHIMVRPSIVMRRPIMMGWPLNFTPLKYHHPLQSEPLGRLFLHLSTMLNLAVASVCPWDCWLWSYKRNARNSPAKKNRPPNFTPLNHHHHLQSERLGRLFLHLSNTLNLAVASVCPWDRWLWSYRRNAENSVSIKNSAHQTSPPSITITTYNQNALEGCFCTFQPCWIDLRSPFVHGTAGSGATGKNVENSAILFYVCISGLSEKQNKFVLFVANVRSLTGHLRHC